MKEEESLSIAGVPVFIDADSTSLFDALKALERIGSIHLICDTNTSTDCMPLLPYLAQITKEPIILPVGEQYKNLETCQGVWRSLAQQGANRNSTVVNLGGGVVTDLGGFCAATYMRGISFMHIPTTVLGMCDAALGGKHGVDFEGLKNYIGVIEQPKLIWIHTPFLLTLPLRHFQSGLAEIVKHALIGDPLLFQLLHGNINFRTFNKEFLTRAIQVKKHFVENDIQDHKMRAALNFGHTFGHAIESYFLHTDTPLLHGECVALGMIAEIWLSHVHLGEPTREVCRKITALIRKCTPVDVPGKIKLRALMPYLSMDKKQHAGATRYSLIKGIGHPVIDQEVHYATLEKLLQDDEVALFLPWLLR
ncbi:MAG TPA: 3-dehydroquinate synthase family protein [Saprospiraceae bacterium]|nr:3-dehydroquinate synthase family protein [Saprospiraceae bacterium]